MNLDSMMAQAKTFCAIQPCTRFAEGEIVIGEGREEQAVPICPRHFEYYAKFFGNTDFDPTIIGKETVFVDDVQDDDMVDEIIADGDVHEIIVPR